MRWSIAVDERPLDDVLTLQQQPAYQATLRTMAMHECEGNGGSSTCCVDKSNHM